jgi:hypothetical protein
VTPDLGEKFHPLGAGAVVGAVIDDEHRLALVAGEPVENTEQSSSQRKQQATPVEGIALEQLADGILTKGQVANVDVTARKVFSDQGQ